MGVLPYFKWYPKDAETDEHWRMMDDSQRGFFMRCLDYSWLNGGIPADPDMRARVLGDKRSYVDKQWFVVGQCFEPSPDDSSRLINPRQYKELLGAITKSDKACASASQRNAQKVPGFIYLIKRSSDGAVKIGSSNNVPLRLAQLKYKYHGDGLELLESVAVDSMGDSEVSLHAEFEQQRIRGEWFTLSQNDISHILITLEGDSRGDSGVHPSPRAIARASYGSESESESESVFVSEKSTASVAVNGSQNWKEEFFEGFWAIVWAKIGKGAAHTAWCKCVKNKDHACAVIKAASEQGPLIVEAARASQRAVLHPATWLNQGRFDDDLLALGNSLYNEIAPKRDEKMEMIHRAADRVFGKDE